MKAVPRPLSGNSLVEGLLAGDPRTLSLFPGDPRDIEAYRKKAAEVEQRFAAAGRSEAASLLLGGGPARVARLKSFVDERGFVVTTGQQPGLFGGPLYALYKGLTAAALARRLEDALGRPVLPVFWIASEDHDWDEARVSHVIDPENVVREVALPSREGAPALPIHRIVLGPEINEARSRFLALHPETEFLPRWKELIEEAYVPGATLAGAFQLVMEAILGPAGVFLIQAHESGLKSGSLPVLLKELAEARERASALEARASELERAGHALQVPILDGASNLFLEGREGRERLLLDGDGFRTRSSGQRLTFREVADRAADDPLTLSPNVLLRPVVEGALFPTLAYVGGPAEVAYLPQTAPMFTAHGIARPLVHPRAGLCLVEAKIDKAIRKHGIQVADLELPDHELASRLLREGMPPAVEKALAGLKAALEKGAEDLDQTVGELDPTLRGPVGGLRTQGLALVADVERKVLQSLRRENGVALSQVAKARTHLFPLGKPQERVLNAFYYLVRYDRELLSLVEDSASGAVLPHPSRRR